MPTMTTAGVTLRAHLESDVPALVEQCLDPLVRRWTTVPLAYDAAKAEHFVREVMPGGWATGEEWGFAVEVEGRYAGTVTLRAEVPGRVEIAYASHPWARGRGVMHAGLRMLLDWGFAAQGVQTVVWRANRGNFASRKAAWRLGFTVAGTLRRYLDHRGELVDAWVGTLLRGDPREPPGTWLEIPTLRSERVVLRAGRDDDVPRILEAGRDERLRHWLAPMPTPYGEADAREWLLTRQESAAEGRTVPWVLADPVDDRLLGSLDLFGIRARGSAMIGYWTHPDARGRGLMGAAVPLALAHAFDGLGLAVVQIGTAPDNAASRHVIEALGLFSPVGLERSRITVGEGRSDALLYDVTAADWARRPR